MKRYRKKLGRKKKGNIIGGIGKELGRKIKRIKVIPVIT